MLKYKNENQELHNKIQELEHTIKSANTNSSIQKKEMTDYQRKTKTEAMDYQTQINELENKIGLNNK